MDDGGEFTVQAQEQLRAEVEVFGARLKEEAGRVAFSSRRKPIEVTAADVERARAALLRPDMPGGVRGLAKAYQIGGLAMVVFAIVFWELLSGSSGIVTEQLLVTIGVGIAISGFAYPYVRWGRFLPGVVRRREKSK